MDTSSLTFMEEANALYKSINEMLSFYHFRKTADIKISLRIGEFSSMVHKILMSVEFWQKKIGEKEVPLREIYKMMSGESKIKFVSNLFCVSSLQETGIKTIFQRLITSDEKKTYEKLSKQWNTFSKIIKDIYNYILSFFPQDGEAKEQIKFLENLGKSSHSFIFSKKK